MNNPIQIAIIGCGDYVNRWESGTINNSKKVKVKSLFDINRKQAEKLNTKLNGNIVDSVEEIFNDNEIDIVCLFVPPWIRKELILKAVKAGKHIITTKPLAASIDDCNEMVDAVENSNLKCGVFYGRSGNAEIETYKKIFDSGEIGNLALYKQDWIHHYPEWNDWATDSEKNGGPFMDAMIHNMNTSRYLMNRAVTNCTLFSDNHAHNLKCNDTEFMKLDFSGNGSAHLFITWAADLEVFSKDGNDREHIDIMYMVTDQGWRLTTNGATVEASRNGEKKSWEIEDLETTPYDAVAESIGKNIDLPSDIPNIRMAAEDIRIMRTAEKEEGQKIEIDFL